MGSDSDWPVMEQATKLLIEAGVEVVSEVVSAHRTPDKMVEFAKNATSKGFQVVIAGAGGAAHLPGMVAALTPLPVIGVPVPLATLEGMDSLLSIVQMPSGIPVATVGIGQGQKRRDIGFTDSRAISRISWLFPERIDGESDQRVTVQGFAAALREATSVFSSESRPGFSNPVSEPPEVATGEGEDRALRGKVRRCDGERAPSLFRGLLSMRHPSGSPGIGGRRCFDIPRV